MTRTEIQNRSAVTGKAGLNVVIVSLLFALAIGTVVWLAGQKQPNQAVASEKSRPVGETLMKTSTSLSPDMSQANPYDFIAPIPVGKAAPDFTTTDAAGQKVSLSELEGKKNVVLLFYQGSFCSVCAHQLANVQSHLKDFEAQNTSIMAISADDTAHAKQTLGELGLSFNVIPDPKKEIIKSFGVSNVVRQNIAYPTAFIVDKKGIVRFNYADPQGKRVHSDELLPELSKLTGKPAPQLGYEQ